MRRGWRRGDSTHRRCCRLPHPARRFGGRPGSCSASGTGKPWLDGWDEGFHLDPQKRCQASGELECGSAARQPWDTPPEWPPPPSTGAARYPLKFRSLLREAYTRGAVGRSVIQQELKLDDTQIDELIEAAPVISCDDTDQEWDEHAALGAVSA